MVPGYMRVILNPKDLFRGFVVPLALVIGGVGDLYAADKQNIAKIEAAALEEGTAEFFKAANLPAILMPADVSRYRVIFKLQRSGEWKAADKIIKKLEDRILMGHVLAQRYLHPTKYRSRYRELKAWMADYADHPEAERIYKLAL